MFTETELRVKGLQILTTSLGPIDAERFITLIMREPFDYTEWQKQLWENVPLKELSTKAMEFYDKKNLNKK